MWLRSFHLRNFKSFGDSGKHQLDRHVNVVVGQNNVGKTALLQALSHQLSGVPHKSSRLRREDMPDPRSLLDFEFALSGQELKDTLLSFQSDVQIPIPAEWGDIPEHSKDTILACIFEQSEITLIAQQQAQLNGAKAFYQPHYPSITHNRAGAGYFVRVARAEDHASFIIFQHGQGEADSVAKSLIEVLQPKIYFFNAQRSPRATYPYGNQTRLLQGAENLAEVLGMLQPYPTSFRTYVEQVRRVLPLIKWLNVTGAGGNETEIHIWQVEEATGRSDLTVPLSQCGTGVGQVLAILYVVTQSSGNVIIIDEPSSFLHPRAAKALMNILREDKNNQYIVSTHSPEVITAIDPARLIMLGFEQEATTVKEIDRADLDSTRDVLDSLGSRLSDVFGADYIVWVEGPTEVQCFPLLLRAAGVNTAANLAIAALRATGDLEGRHAEAITDIYRNLSRSHAIIPRTVSLSLDGDKRHQLENSKVLKNVFGDVLHFLPRYCYENYLLDCSALVALLNELTFFREKPVAVNDIREWIEANGNDEKFGAAEYKTFSSEWLASVNGAELLEELFQSLSNGTEIYRKTLYSPQLTKWMLENSETSLKELIGYVVELVPAAQQVA
jgi:ABC-type cobalamin/Fe3+-siderophores transport system ATPase subunit